MENSVFSSNAAERSVNENNSQVSNSSKASSKSRKKTVKRNNFTVAKSKTVVNFDRVLWLKDSTSDGSITKENLFRKCLTKAIGEMEGYNESAFKKDLAMHMAFLLNDRRFHNSCWDGGWNLFETAQILAWAKSSDFQKIRDFGITNVKGFDTPEVVVYSFDEMKNDLKVLGFDDNYFKNDPYTSHYKSEGGKLK